MRLNHLHLTSSVVEATKNFYQRYFGFRELAKLPKTTVLTNEDQFILALDETEVPVHLPSPCHLGFSLGRKEDVEGLYSKMCADGVVFEKEMVSPSPNALHFYCLDPNRNSIEVGWYKFFSVMIALALLAGCGRSPSSNENPIEERAVVKWAEVREKVLGPKCIGCHFEKNPSKISNLDNFDRVKNNIGSIFFLAVAKETMPPTGKLSRTDKELLSHWVVDGMQP